MLLHACCGPCSLASVAAFRETGLEPVLYYFNPNIHPYAEYDKRRRTLLDLAEQENVALVLSPEYPLREYLEQTLAAENRCAACYRLRLEQTARTALQLGLHRFSTTLLISPYQQHSEIRRLGEELAVAYNVEFCYLDLRPHFSASQNRARERGYYLQNYCGCLFSEATRWRKEGL